MREEESHHLLKEFSEIKTLKAIKNNEGKYLKIQANANSDDSVDGFNAGKPSKREKVKCPEKAGINKRFIKRNIQLAKCGDGVLSLTDEEKIRLQAVLMDIDGPAEKSTDADVYGNDKMQAPKENEYALNDETKKIIEEIDRKLEKYENMKFLSMSMEKTKERVTEQSENAEKDDNSEEKKITQNPRDFLKNEFKRLKKVDDLLNALNSTTYEEIDPLYDEDLQFLIEESKQTLSMMTKIDKLEIFDDGPLNKNSSTLSNNQIPPVVQDAPSKEEISEMISAAKNIMPNFKFRYKY